MVKQRIPTWMALVWSFGFVLVMPPLMFWVTYIPGEIRLPLWAAIVLTVLYVGLLVSYVARFDRVEIGKLWGTRNEAFPTYLLSCPVPESFLRSGPRRLAEQCGATG